MTTKRVDLDPIAEALEQMPYGLYIIGSRGEDNINGMMADWVMQVSFSPRLVAVSFENNSHTLANVRERPHFTVNLLAQDDESRLKPFGKKPPHFSPHMGSTKTSRFTSCWTRFRH